MLPFDIIQNKIIKTEELDCKLSYWRFKDYRIVFTNGCFDILHAGHIEYLSKAASEGHILLIGLNSDESVMKIKGHNRPINNQLSRSLVLASLFFVTGIIIFNEDTPYQLIKHIQPDVLIKGNDYKIEEIAGFDIVQAKGGIIKTIELTPGYSTTAIEQKIVNNYRNKN